MPSKLSSVVSGWIQLSSVVLWTPRQTHEAVHDPTLEAICEKMGHQSAWVGMRRWPFSRPLPALLCWDVHSLQACGLVGMP